MMTLSVYMEVTQVLSIYYTYRLSNLYMIYNMTIPLFLDLCPDGAENDKFFIRNAYKDSKGSSVFDKNILENDISCLRTVIVLSVNQKPSDGAEKTEICKYITKVFIDLV